MRFVSLLSVILTVQTSLAQDLESILAKHETAVASLRYLRCQYTKTDQFPSHAVPKILVGNLTCGPGVLLLTAKGVNYESGLLARPGRFEVFNAFKRLETNQLIAQSNITATRKVLEDADPLRDIMISFDMETMLAGRGGLRELVKRACKNQVVDEGAEVRIPFADSTGSIRLSKKYNYLVLSSESRSAMNGAKYIASHSVTEFIPGPNGVYIPVAGEILTTRNGEFEFSYKTKLTNIDTSPFDETAIQLRYPKKMEVVNRIDGTKYTVDEMGNKVSPTEPFVPLVVGVGPDSKESRLPTQVEESRFGWWLIPAGLSIVFVAYAIVLFARARARRNE